MAIDFSELGWNAVKPAAPNAQASAPAQTTKKSEPDIPVSSWGKGTSSETSTDSQPLPNNQLNLLESLLAQRSFNQLDTNKNGALSREELASGASNADPITRYAAKGLTNKFDGISQLDGKEGISRDDLRRALPPESPHHSKGGSGPGAH